MDEGVGGAHSPLVAGYSQADLCRKYWEGISKANKVHLPTILKNRPYGEDFRKKKKGTGG